MILVAVVVHKAALVPRRRGADMQVGDYALTQRVAAYLWRGVQFFGLGFGSSAVGHTLTKVLVRHLQDCTWVMKQGGCCVSW